jgi:predicted  nucleic acid-binding Zn ribbon protein
MPINELHKRSSLCYFASNFTYEIPHKITIDRYNVDLGALTIVNSFTMSFEPIRPLQNKDDFLPSITTFIECLYENGQILDDYQLILYRDLYTAVVTLPEDCALDDKYNNKEVMEILTELRLHFTIYLDLLGEDLECGEACNCSESPPWYMLYADEQGTIPSPIICGECANYVPLYKLPYITQEKNHHRVLSWKDTCQSNLNLWLHDLSDRFIYPQLNRPNSKLAKEGREICAEYEAATGTAFYYYLFYNLEFDKKNNKKTIAFCPVCGSKWKLPEDETFVSCKCIRCRLVADDDL